MSFEVFINKKSKPESVPVKEVKYEYDLKYTTRERFFNEAEKIKSDIIARDVKLGIKRVEKKARNENIDYRTLRELESKFQNRILRVLVGRDRFFGKKSISKDQEENLYSATRTAFDSHNPKDSHNYASGIVKGINAVYERVSDVYSRAVSNNEAVVIGTDDYLDSAHEIDLLEFYDDKINLTQVKNSTMNPEDIKSIHQKHKSYLDSAHKNSLEYLHSLVDTHVKKIEDNLEGKPEFYSHIKSISDFLEWVKIYYDEKHGQGEIKIDDSFLEECAGLHDNIDQFDFEYTDMSLIFQKGDILHKIFMLDVNGPYNNIFNKINNSREKLPKKDLLKIKKEGITSILYNEDFFGKIIESDILNDEEKFKFGRYVDMMRALDEWSINKNEEMTNHEIRTTYKKYQRLIGIDINEFIENAHNVHSVVVHGGVVNSIKISKETEL